MKADALLNSSAEHNVTDETWGIAMIIDLLNPVVLGTASGTAIVVGLAGFLLARFVERFSGSELSRFGGFLLAGAFAVCLAAFGLADGEQPKWVQAGLMYGVPAGFAAVAALLLFKLFVSDGKSRGIGNVLIVAALLAGALIGARLSLVEQAFADEDELFSDPLMAGFQALEESYPALWSELVSDIKDAEMTGASAFPIAANFYQEHLPELTKLASDAAVVNMAETVKRKLEFLAHDESALCLQIVAGRPDARIAAILPYDLKLEEAAALEELVSSSGKGNSGVARQEEAEAFAIAAWERLASEDPERFYASVSFISGEAIDSNLACEGFIKLQGFMLERTEADYARFSRSDFNLNPDTEMSAEAEVRMALVSLYAEAASVNRSAPQQIDPVTTIIGANYVDGTLSYLYQLSSPVGDGKTIVQFFETELLPGVCSDESLAWAIGLGAALEYRYEGSDGRQASVVIDSARCEK